MKTLGTLATVLLSTLLVACGSGQKPTEQLTTSKSAVAAAEAVDSEENPEAALYLKLARDGVASAEELIDDEEYAEATRTLQRAEVDAELALALSRRADSQQEAKAALEDVDDLRKRME